jgi:hypothetical protein
MRKHRTTTAIALIISAFYLLTPFRANAQAPLARSVFDYLTPQEGNSFTLELDLTELRDHKNTNEYFPASLTTGDGQLLAAEIRPRGKYRRRLCDIPPLKLKFKKKALRGLGLDTLNEVKLLLPCFDERESETLILREYIAYRMFEQLDPQHSVRARLVNITLRDRHIEKTHPPVYALLIEHEEQVAARLGGHIESPFKLSAEAYEPESVALNAMFQFMIGNTDWGLADNRNVYQLRPNEGGLLKVLPFDFDFSGLVNAPYASPGNLTGLSSVRDRLLQADGIAPEALQAAATRIKSQKEALLALCNPGFLDKKNARWLTEYLTAFFQELESSGEIPRRMKSSLR